MSNRIDEVLEVVEDVRERFLENPSANTKTMRIQAVKLVAAQRHIDARSVLDKCARQLQPDVKDAVHFDQLLEMWLKEQSKLLCQAMLNHASDSDILLINSFFQNSMISLDANAGLANEFGYAPTEKMFLEGREVLKLHLIKERNAGLVKNAKEVWSIAQDGNVLCSICGFSFLNRYGDIGAEYIKAHHKIPISTLTSETSVTIDDLDPVCSNCHRILHRRKPWLSVGELRQVVLQTSKT